MHSDPPYPEIHSGTVLVCGYGPTLYDDYERARQIRPNAEVIAVNRAAKFVKAFALFSLHAELMGDLFCEEQRRRFGPGFTTHSGGRAGKWPDRRQRFPWVEYWWAEASGKGTSAWAAARMARLMGFEEVILCGVSLEKGGYADGRMAPHFQKDKMLRIYRSFVRNDTDWHAGVYSMSGYTRKILGAPSENPH